MKTFNDAFKEVLGEIADGQMEMAKSIRIEKLGWRYHPLLAIWIHPDAHDDLGHRPQLENVDDVLEYIAR